MNSSFPHGGGSEPQTPEVQNCRASSAIAKALLFFCGTVYFGFLMGMDLSPRPPKSKIIARLHLTLQNLCFLVKTATSYPFASLFRVGGTFSIFDSICHLLMGGGGGWVLGRFSQTRVDIISGMPANASFFFFLLFCPKNEYEPRKRVQLYLI